MEYYPKDSRMKFDAQLSIITATKDNQSNLTIRKRKEYITSKEYSPDACSDIGNLLSNRTFHEILIL